MDNQDQNQFPNGKYTPDSKAKVIVMGPGALIELGNVYATKAVMDAISVEDGFLGLVRHMHGDWGLVPLEDWNANNMAVINGGRILSAYDSDNGVRFWIITEADRSSTTILLPEDY